MSWLLLRVDTVYDSLFIVKTINGDIENLAPDSARELGEGLEGAVYLIGNFVGVKVLVVSLHSPKVYLLPSQHPLTQRRK